MRTVLIDYRRVKKPLNWKNLIVEIGFGRGDFILELAKKNPDRKILGFEISGISIGKLIKRIKKESISNLYCVQLDAYWGFYLLLEEESVDKIYINYPDPWFKKRHHKRRLTCAENLYLFSKKLSKGGEINIRTDHLPFAEYTIEQASKIKAFKIHFKKLCVSNPLTKYEEKWLSMGKDLHEIILIKEKNPIPLTIRELKEVEMLFPIKVKGKNPVLQKLLGKEVKLEERIYLRFFKVYRGSSGEFLIETLISEEGFVQRFFITLYPKGEVWIVDISPFSQILRTEGLQKAVEFVAKEVFTFP